MIFADAEVVIQMRLGPTRLRSDIDYLVVTEQGNVLRVSSDDIEGLSLTDYIGYDWKEDGDGVATYIARGKRVASDDWANQPRKRERAIRIFP